MNIKNIWEFFLKKYYKKTPLIIRKLISPFIIILKYRILRRLKHFYLPVYLLTGREKSGNFDLSILFISDKISIYYITSILFSKNICWKYIGNVFVWNSKKIVKKFSKKIDAVFIKTDRFFSEYLRDNGYILIPDMVEMKLNTSQSYEQLFKKFKKSAIEDIRVIKKNRYTYEITKDPIKFNHFYHQIRMPYIFQRLGKLTLPETVNYEETKDIFQRSKLLLVKDKDKFISGFLLLDHLDTSHAAYMGILNSSSYLQRGAGTALYYFSIIWAKDNNINILDFGNNRSFLNDGSFQYKRKWGSNIQISERFSGVYGFKIINYQSNAIVDFLTNNPFIFMHSKDLYGIVFAKNILTDCNIQNIFNKFYTTGIKQIYVISLKENLEEIFKNLNTKTHKKFEQKIVLNSKNESGEIQDKIITYNNGVFQFVKFKNEIRNDDSVNYQCFADEYNLKIEQAKHILSKKYEKQFISLVGKYPEFKNEIIKTYIHTFSTFLREGINLKKIDDKIMSLVFNAISRGIISKDAIPTIIRYMVINNNRDINKVIDSLKLYKIENDELAKIIEKVVTDNKEVIHKRGLFCLNYLMGIIMKELRGKINGEIVSKILMDKIEKIIE